MHVARLAAPREPTRVERHLGEVADITRARVLEQLDKVSESHRVIVVSGPAGYGKSVLLRQWVEQRNGRHLIDDVLRAGDTVELRARHADGVGVDEAHPATAPLTDDALALLVRRLPLDVTVVVARRSPPSEHTASILGVESVGSIDARDLTFTAAETEALLVRLTRRDLTSAPIARVGERTDGWPAGVLLAGLALREGESSGPDDERDWGSVDRHVRSYLRNEVLDRLAEDDRRFLLRTSLLRELRADVCDAVMGTADARVRLDALHSTGFITRSERPDDVVYSCHRLLRECLRETFRSADPVDARAVAARAARWYREQSRPDLALEQFAQVEDWEAILAEVAQHGRDLFARDLGDETLRYIRAVPAPIRGRNPQALFEFAVLQGAAGDARGAEETMSLLDPLELGPGERAVLHVIRASWVRNHARPATAARSAQAALDVLRRPTPVDVPDVFGLTSPTELPALAVALRGTARWYAGDDAGALADFEESEPGHAAFALFHVRNCGQLALLHAWAGRLCTAEDYVTRGLLEVEARQMDGHRVTAELLLARARIARERGDLQAAESHLREARCVASRHNETVSLVVCALEHALLHLATGQLDAGLQTLENGRRAHTLTPETRFTPLFDTIEARLRLRLGQRDYALGVLSMNGVRETPDAYPVAVEAAVLARAFDTAVGVVEAWPEVVDLRPRLDKEIWTAVVDRFCGRRTAAIRRFMDILPEAEAQGTFEPSSMVALPSCRSSVMLRNDTTARSCASSSPANWIRAGRRQPPSPGSSAAGSSRCCGSYRRGSRPPRSPSGSSCRETR